MLEHFRAIQSNEPLVEPLLSLAAKVLQGACQQNDQPIARVGGLARQCGVGRRLAGLDVPNHQTAPCPAATKCGVARKVQDVIGHPV